MVQLQADHPGLKWIQPKTGAMIWTDNMLIPKGGDVFTASTFMNFVYDPKVAAQIEAYVNYICPVKGAEEAMAALDDSLVGNSLIFPSPDDLAGTFAFMATDTKTREKFDKDFNQVIGA